MWEKDQTTLKLQTGFTETRSFENHNGVNRSVDKAFLEIAHEEIPATLEDIQCNKHSEMF